MLAAQQGEVMSKQAFAVAVVVALLLAPPGAVSAQSGASPLDAEATRKLASGNTWVVRGTNVTVFNTSDGKRVLVRGARGPEYGGRWWIDEAGHFCSSIPTVRNGQVTCGGVSTLGDDVYIFIDIEFTVETGNVRGVGN